MKKTTAARPVRPFRSADDALLELNYRSYPDAEFHSIIEHGLEVLEVEDLRNEAIHEFKIKLDDALLANLYGKLASSLSFLIVARDPIARNVYCLHRGSISEGVVVASIDPAVLRTSSLRDQIRFEFMVGLTESTDGKAGLPRRKGSWVFRRTFTVSRDLAGPTIPFWRATSADFQAKGLPAATTWWLNVFEGPEKLLEAADRLEDVFQVWVHEDVWTLLQEIGKTRADQALGRCLAASMLVAILQTAAPALAESGATVDETSVTQRLLAWIAQKNSTTVSDLASKLRKGGGNDLAPLIWATLDCTKLLKTADFRNLAE